MKLPPNSQLFSYPSNDLPTACDLTQNYILCGFNSGNLIIVNIAQQSIEQVFLEKSRITSISILDFEALISTESQIFMLNLKSRQTITLITKPAYKVQFLSQEFIVFSTPAYDDYDQPIVAYPPIFSQQIGQPMFRISLYNLLNSQIIDYTSSQVCSGEFVAVLSRIGNDKIIDFFVPNIPGYTGDLIMQQFQFKTISKSNSGSINHLKSYKSKEFFLDDIANISKLGIDIIISSSSGISQVLQVQTISQKSIDVEATLQDCYKISKNYKIVCGQHSLLNYQNGDEVVEIDGHKIVTFVEKMGLGVVCLTDGGAGFFWTSSSQYDQQTDSNQLHEKQQPSYVVQGTF